METTLTTINHILLVDDDEVSNFLSTKIIGRAAVIDKIDVLLNGYEASEFFDDCTESSFPDLVFLDINMPLMNGFEVLEHYEEKGYIGKTKFIILTTSTHKKDKDSSKNYKDVIGYIEKPLTVNKIKELLPDF